MNQGRQLEERIGPAGFTVTSVTPKRISARLSIQIEDVGTVGQANFELILRENLALVLADELDKQAINGDCSAPNLTGIFQRPANPSAPGAVADFDAYAAAHAGGVDGLWAHTIKDVGIIVGPGTCRHASRVFQTAVANYKGELSAAAYAVVLQLCGLTNGYVPNLTVGAVRRNYQYMRRRLHCFALLTHRDPAVPAC